MDNNLNDDQLSNENFNNGGLQNSQPANDSLKKALKKPSNPPNPLKKNNSLKTLNPLGNTGAEADKIHASVNFLKNVKLYGTIGGVFFGFLLFFIIIIACINFVQSFSPLDYINSLFNTGDELFYGYDIEELATGCSNLTEEECEEAKSIYKEIVEVHEDYLKEKNVNLNINYLTIALFNEAVPQDDAVDYVSKLAENMIKSETYDVEKIDDEGNVVLDEDGNIVMVEVTVYHLDIEAFETYLKDEFIIDYYLNGVEDAARVSLIFKDMQMKLHFYENYDTGSSSLDYHYSYCAGVTVIDQDTDEVIGTYELEEYVAGVVSKEAYSYFHPEALKAQAIAARTYVLNATKNCVNPIKGGDEAQAFTENINEPSRNATEETRGMILTYNGEVFSAMYDSFCYADTGCPDALKNSDGSYTVTYKKMPNLEEHIITLSTNTNLIVPGGGHAHGMSQLLADEMADNGDNYEQILSYFYSDGVEIQKMLVPGFPLEPQWVVIRNSQSDFGSREKIYVNGVWIGNSLDHKGVDFSADEGSPIFSIEDGVVTDVNYNSAAGYYVVIGHGDLINGYYELYSMYGHMVEKSELQIGDIVSIGEIIGGVGSTGVSSGPHLHFEISNYVNGVEVHLDPAEHLGIPDNFP